LPPGGVFAIIATGMFAALALATALAHALLPADAPLTFEILANAAALTLVCAPLTWKFVVQPLHRAADGDRGMARTVLNAVVDGVVTIDEFGIVREFNHAAAAMFGHAAADVVGRNVSMLVPSPHRERHDAYLARYRDTGVPHVLGKVVEVEAMRRDGTRFPVALSVSEVRGAAGREFVAIVRDMSLRKRIEDELRHANTLLERVFSTTHAMFAFLDRDFNFIKVNRAYAEGDERAPEDYTGKNHFVMYPNPENEAIFRGVVETGRPHAAFAKPFTYAQHPERGTTYWDWYVDPVRGADGAIDGVLLSVVNVTERVRLQQVESLLQQIDQLTLSGEPVPAVLDFICAQTARTFNLLFAWIGRKEDDGGITVMAALESAREHAEELRRTELRWVADSPSGRGPTGIAIRTGKTTTYGSDPDDPAPHHASARRLSVHSGISIPLVVRGEIYGVFSLYSNYENVFAEPWLAQNLNVIADRTRVALEIAEDQQQLRLLGAALASAGNAIFITDRGGRIEWANASFTRMCGYAERELRGQNPRFLASGQQDADYYRRLWGSILGGNVLNG
jgi:PAS domain S-box-containing protein